MLRSFPSDPAVVILRGFLVNGSSVEAGGVRVRKLDYARVGALHVFPSPTPTL